MLGLRGLHIDTGDAAFDATAPKHIRVTTGYNEYRMVRILHGAPKVEDAEAGRPRSAPDP